MKYAKSTILFGILIPGAVVALLIVVLIFGFAAFSKKASVKKKAWDEHHERQAQIAILDASLAPDRDKIAFEKEILSRDIQADLGSFLDEQISSPLGAKLFKRSLDFPTVTGTPDRGAFPVRPVEMGFVGRYDALQDLCLNMETKFPQLHLMSYNLQRVEASPTIPKPHLDIKLTFKSYQD